jgi:hypothetical protein
MIEVQVKKRQQKRAKMITQIAKELKRHAPFTIFGATTGIAIMVIIVLGSVPAEISYDIFYVLHPLHVVLSALVTTAIYKLHTRGKL